MTSEEEMRRPPHKEAVTWSELNVGQVIPEFSYVLTKEQIRDYRDCVGDETASYPTVAARHPAQAFYRAFGREMRLPNAGYECQYFTPPLPDSTIFVRGRIADKYLRRGKKYLVVESVAVDDSGRLIEVARLIGLASDPGEQALRAVAAKGDS